jgi:hypothetical protein
MTVAATTPIIRYTYNGVGDYTFAFRIFEDSDLVVTHTDTDGVEDVLTLTTDYTVAITGETGGTVTTLAPVVTTGTLEIKRILPYTQTTAMVNNGPLDMEVLEAAYDKAIMLLQQMKVVIDGDTTTLVWKGWWTTATGYEVLNTVVNGSKYYQCVADHTSGVLATDIASGYWIVIADFGTVVDLSDYAPLASPTLTGVPRAPTAATTTGTTQIATTAFVQDELDLLAFGPMAVQIFSTPGTATYTKTSGATVAVVEVLGGGGGGSGSTSSNYGSAGSGGGYARKRLSLSAVTSETVTVGAAGTAGTNTSNGVAGGSSSLGSLVSATGGGAGKFNTFSDEGGIGTGGDINIRGGRGSVPGNYRGGSSIYGVGGASITPASVAAGVGYGAGGAGCSGGAPATGGAGTAGIVIVTEY